MMSMETPTPMSLMSCLFLVDDPRRAGYARRHDLQEILTIAVCAVLCDMNTFEEVAFWAPPRSDTTPKPSTPRSMPLTSP